MSSLDDHAKGSDVEVLNATLNKDDLLLGNTSSRSQLDIEQDYSDVDELPPLETYLSGWKFWCKFAIWPGVFLLLNAIVIFTLIVVDEYEFQYGRRRHRFFGRNYDFIYDNPRMFQNVRIELMRYNRIVIIILLSLDALVVYRAVKFLEKSVREFDMIGEMDEVDGVQSHQQENAPVSSSIGDAMKPNVHAQVSRRLDSFLGRGSHPRVSIFVSLLWLLFVGCTAIGTVAFADWLFTYSPKAKSICMGSSDTGKSIYDQGSDDAFNPSRSNSTKNIENIPDELQDWARKRHDPTDGLVHLTNGVTFFSAIDPREAQEQEDMAYFGRQNQLVSINEHGEIRFRPNVRSPRDFTSVTTESVLNSTSFCCLYTQRETQTFYEYGFYPSTSVLCVKASDDISSEIFPNVTVYKYSEKKDSRTVDRNFDGSSLTSFNNELWVQNTYSEYNFENGNMRTSMEFFKIEPKTSLELTFVTKTSFSGYSSDENFGEPFLWGPNSPCYKWTKYIDLAVLLLVLVPASAWMIFLKNLSAGVVPVCIATFFFLAHINNDLSIALCSISAAAVLLALLGFLPIPLSREKLVWGLYAMLASIAGMLYSGRFYMFFDNLYSFERALITISIGSLIGFILNHPVLYIFGWVGGIWAVFCGVFLLFTPEHHRGIFAIGLGIFMGSGCVTVGFNLIKYRAHLLFYSKRAWSAMNNAMQHSGGSERGSQRNHSSTARYASVSTPTVPTTPIRSPAPGRGEHDITTGLLIRNNGDDHHDN